MQIPPASVLNSWPPPNHVNPETRGPVAIITVSILLFFVTAILGVRVYTRVRISKGFGLDDVLILVAYIPTAGFAIVSFVAQAKFDWGRHVWDLPIQLFTPGFQLNMTLQLLFDLATTLTKLSMLALIYRLVSVSESRYKYLVISIIGLVSFDGIIFFILVIFQCSPIDAYWTLSAVPQKCLNEPKHLLAAGCINTTTDFFVMVLPVPYIRRLKLPRKQQIIVISLFAGGIFVTAAGAVRTAITYIFFSDPNKDLTWNAIPIIIATSLELFLGIICASIPPIKPFFALYLPRVIGNSTHWPSGDSQHRIAGIDSISDGSSDPDFWLVTNPESVNRDAESPPLVMQMRAPAPMPGMPAPLRPPRTQSTMGTFSFPAPPPRPNLSSTLRPDSPSSASTTSTSILLLKAPAPVNLNKPLPTIRSSSLLDEMLDSMSEAEIQDVRMATMSTKMASIYQFVPHEDGHLSVHRTGGNSHGDSDWRF